jgi:hypothetical protein
MALSLVSALNTMKLIRIDGVTPADKQFTMFMAINKVTFWIYVQYFCTMGRVAT